MRAAPKQAQGRYDAGLDRWVRPRGARDRAANDNAAPDRAEALTVAIGQASAAIAGICGIVAIALMITH
ncbi:hypothetical protein MKK69_20885 [Methylobacterium sp. J-026]|uniref:hypothetical protein n=1 Tax=Methylobacterium sp. J-026 TaxID=2836624 RepID=UPI001FB93ABC|nr:hypothetical protein [Methylobacterium sp. J-026]MCJ2136476.1 hypothetical protein [Methylobacterium sp. J-026]